MATLLGGRWSALALVPAVVWLSLFFLVPLLIVALISGMRVGSPVEWSLDGSAYGRMLDPLYLRIVLRSVGLALCTTAICLILGYPLAYYIARMRPGRRYLLYFMVLIPLWANSLVLIYAWMILLRPSGVLDQILHAVGFGSDAPLSVLYTPWAVIVGLVYWYLPFMVYPLYAAIEKLDFNLLDAAYDLGANRLQAFWHVLLPLTWPGVITG
jgi:spermidine/putrescine transport system permease protein